MPSYNGNSSPSKEFVGFARNLLYRFDPSTADFNDPQSLHEFTLAVSEYEKSSKAIVQILLHEFYNNVGLGDGKCPPELRANFHTLLNHGHVLMWDLHDRLGPTLHMVPDNLKRSVMIDNMPIADYLWKQLGVIEAAQAQLTSEEEDDLRGPYTYKDVYTIDADLDPLPQNLTDISFPSHSISQIGDPPWTINPAPAGLSLEIQGLMSSLSELRHDCSEDIDTVETQIRRIHLATGYFSLLDKKRQVFDTKRETYGYSTLLPNTVGNREIMNDTIILKTLCNGFKHIHNSKSPIAEAEINKANTVLASTRCKSQNIIRELAKITREISKSPWLHFDCQRSDNSWGELQKIYIETHGLVTMLEMANSGALQIEEEVRRKIQMAGAYINTMEVFISFHKVRLRLASSPMLNHSSHFI